MTDHTLPVGIFFEDGTITELFSDLLQAHGVHTRILTNADDIPLTDKVITEVQYFHRITPTQMSKCLIVGNKATLNGIPALSLSRPLTEDKVENALKQFLGA